MCLLITGGGDSIYAEAPAGADKKIKVTYVENPEQTDTEESVVFEIIDKGEEL